MANINNWYYKPTAEYEQDCLDFEIDCKELGCTCFLAAPCSWCTHPGNPHNGVEFERCYDVGDCGVIVSEFHLNYLLHATRTFGSNVLHMKFAAWSVMKALEATYA